MRTNALSFGLFSSVFAIACILQACANPPQPELPAPTMSVPEVASGGAAPIKVDSPDNDVLGPRPHVKDAAAWKPSAPRVMSGPNGLSIWLFERHDLPLVATALVVPYGSTSDPKDKGGLAWFTANMLDEGAGKRGSLEIARAIDLLGADLSTSARQDFTLVSLSVLKRNLDPAFSIFSDVVQKPTFADAEGRRVHDLWENELKSRVSEPNEVAAIAESRVLFGKDHPYAHPVDGYVASAKHVSLADVKSFYASVFRPDRATLVFAGDVSDTEAQALAQKYFGEWRAPKNAAPEIVTPPAPVAKKRIVLVDREDAPQSVIAVVRPGVAMSSPDFPPLGRVNAALGGSFTSRLNQDLREDHGWTYGAKSRFSFTRGTGMWVASAAVVTEKTADALTALVHDVDAYAKDGPTHEEADKTRLLLRAELVEGYEGVTAAAGRMAREAALGLPPDYDLKASVARDDAHKADLAQLAKKYLEGDSIIVIVGPKKKIEEPLKQAGFTGIEVIKAEEE